MKKFLFPLLAIWAICPVANAAVEESGIPAYKNPALTAEQRAEDLVSRMNVHEKVAQIRHLHSGDIFDGQELNSNRLKQICGSASYGFVEGFPLTGENIRRNMYQVQDFMVNHTRLGIPIFVVGEALHGSVHEGSTIFPQNIALASTFNPEFAEKKAKAISGDLHYQGINQILAPCVDVVRDLRWGRVEETFGEDPFLSSEFALKEVGGYLNSGISPMLKHFGPHGNPSGGLNLSHVQSSVSDFHNIYMKPFEKVITTLPVMAVMSTYNCWNGEPNSASKFLLTDLLRGKWGFRGYVYSDWGAISMLKDFHHVAADEAEAAKLAIEAGLDVEASSSCYPAIPKMIKDSILDQAVLDRAVKRVLIAKFEAGLFEDPFGSITSPEGMHTESSSQLAKQIADESIILLKNQNKLLPLDASGLKSIAVIGPNADQVQYGDYSYTRSNSTGVTPLQGLKNILGNNVTINYAKGCDLMSMDEKGIAEAVAAAERSDVAILFVGSASTALARDYSGSNCGEGYDTPDLELTGAQPQLIRAVAATGKPVVLVLVTGKAYAINWEKENIPAIVLQWYAGEQQGNAIAEMLFGKTNPSGHLPLSFARSAGHLPSFYNHLPSDRGYYRARGSYEKPGRDYVFSTPDPLYAFGYGLSYTDFDITDMKSDTTGNAITVSLTAKNTGDRAGKTVPQIYIRDVVSSIPTPVKQLKAFDKILLQPGESKALTFNIPYSELAFADNQGNLRMEDGEFEIMAGLASDDIRQSKSVWIGQKRKDKTGEDSANAVPQFKGTGKKIKVSGVVRDIQSGTLANIKVYSTKLKRVVATTPVKGTFSITVPDNDILIFGYGTSKEKKTAVNGNHNLNITL